VHKPIALDREVGSVRVNVRSDANAIVIRPCDIIWANGRNGECPFESVRVNVWF